MTTKAVNESSFDALQKMEAFVRERLDAQGLQASEISVRTLIDGVQLHVALERTAQLNALYTMEQHIRQEARRWLRLEIIEVLWRYQPRGVATLSRAA